MDVTVTVDGTAPSLPVFASSSPPLDTWSNDNTVFVDWSPANDSLCGVDGYGELWTTSASAAPSNLKDMEETQTSTTSAPLADGIWYYQLKAVDNAGNWTPGWSSFGPFKIDTTDPEAVTNLSSSSHVVGLPSPHRSVTVSWSPAIDAGSGLDGYSLLWVKWHTAIPDTIKDIEEDVSAQQSPILTPGDWWFFIRSVDRAGNWGGDVASIGPFVIDTPLFADGFESGVTTLWSLVVP